MAVRIPVVSAALIAASSLVTFAGASISSVVGDVQLIGAPADASPNALTSLTQIWAWNEKQNITLGSALRVDGVASGLYDDAADLGVHFVPSGSVVSSHFVHFDTPGETFGVGSGAVTFSDDILAIIVVGDGQNASFTTLDSSDFLGAPATIYPDGLVNRGTEMWNDRFSISVDRKTLTVGALYVQAPGDSIRVITGVVPTPGAGALAAVGGLMLARRRR